MTAPLLHINSNRTSAGVRLTPDLTTSIKFSILIKVLEWVASIEEDGIPVGVVIPEERRIRMHTLMWNQTPGGLYVECMQGPPGGHWIYHKALL